MPDPGLPIADMGPDPDAEMHRAPTPRAAELPDGTVVAKKHVVRIKDSTNNPTFPWRATNGSVQTNGYTDDDLAAGAQVLRYGYERGDSDGE